MILNSYAEGESEGEIYQELFLRMQSVRGVLQENLNNTIIMNSIEEIDQKIV